jgi:hypothetical protein
MQELFLLFVYDANKPVTSKRLVGIFPNDEERQQAKEDIRIEYDDRDSISFVSSECKLGDYDSEGI